MVDTSQLTDYTFAQIKLAAKHAMISAAVGGGTLTINGRTIGRITTKDARDLYDWATEQETVETENAELGGGVAIVKFGERV